MPFADVWFAWCWPHLLRLLWLSFVLIAEFLTGAELAAGLEISARVPGCSADYADSERSNRIKQQLQKENLKMWGGSLGGFFAGGSLSVRPLSLSLSISLQIWCACLFPSQSGAQLGCAVGGASMDLHCTTFMKILPANSEGCWLFIFVFFLVIFLSFGFCIFFCHSCFVVSFFGNLFVMFLSFVKAGAEAPRGRTCMDQRLVRTKVPERTLGVFFWC